MKYHSLFLGLVLAIPGFISAQSLCLRQGNVTYSIPATELGEVICHNGSLFEITGHSFEASSINGMYVSQQTVENNTVLVEYNEAGADVTIAWNIYPYITATVDGGHVNLTQSADVDETTCGEITYVLSGSSDNASLLLEGSYKSTIELRGLNITNPDGAALDIQNGKRIAISAKNGTVNYLTDGNGSQKGAIVCKGHLEFKGKGELTVTGNKSHAIYAKEYVEVKNLTLRIPSSKKDGINCTQYFLMESGTVDIQAPGDDGIQIDYKDAENREAEDTGSATIKGGSLNINITATAAKGVKTEGDILISGGEINIKTTANGYWDSAKSKTKASACLGSDGDINITDGSIDFTATGSGGKGMSCDGNLNINGGDIKILTSGGILAYVNGQEQHNYTGNTDRINSDYKSSPKGIKADGDINITAGTVYVKTTGNGAEGIESKNVLTISGGVIKCFTTDDCINSSSDMIIEGGDILVVSTGNDGLDANGNMFIKGGTVRAFGARAPECGIDVNEEEGKVLVLTGGYILGVGGNSSVPTTTASTQAYIFPTTSLAITASTTISVSSGDDSIVSFEVPAEYTSSTSSGGGNRPPGGGGSGMRILVSTPEMVSGNSYRLTSGSSSTTATATLRSSGGNRPW